MFFIVVIICDYALPWIWICWVCLVTCELLLLCRVRLMLNFHCQWKLLRVMRTWRKLQRKKDGGSKIHSKEKDCNMVFIPRLLWLLRDKRLLLLFFMTLKLSYASWRFYYRYYIFVWGFALCLFFSIYLGMENTSHCGYVVCNYASYIIDTLCLSLLCLLKTLPWRHCLSLATLHNKTSSVMQLLSVSYSLNSISFGIAPYLYLYFYF